MCSAERGWLAISPSAGRRLGEAPRNAKDADGLVFGGTLENDGVEIGDAAGELGEESECGVEFFDALVKLGGALEIEIGAGTFSVGFDRGASE